jgi:hypothetical protein
LENALRDTFSVVQGLTQVFLTPHVEPAGFFNQWQQVKIHLMEYGKN